MSFWDEAKGLFTELPFYNTSIKKTRIKLFNNIDLMCDLPFYDELNIVKTPKEFKGYAKSYSVEI